MSFEIQKGKKPRSQSRSAKIILVTTALCGLTCVQTEGAPAAVHHPLPIRTEAGKSWYAHRSIWAIKWAAAHPAEEAAYQARMAALWRASLSRNSRHPAKPSVTASKPAPNDYSSPRISAAAVLARTPESSRPTPPVVLASTTPTAAPAPITSTVPVHSAPTLVAAQVAKPAPGAAIVQPVATQPAAQTHTEQSHRAAGTLEENNGDVTLDFVAADINDVLKALAVETGVNIVSSTDVKGTITVSLAHVSLEEALDMVTRLSGYQYAKIGSTYVVGTEKGIAAISDNGSDETTVTDIVTFNYVSYSNISSALALRFPDLKIADGSSINGVQDGAEYKAILLSGDPTEVAQARDLITQLDTSVGANVAQQNTVVYKVEYANVPDLINILGSLVPSVTVTPGPKQGFNTKAPSAAAAATSSGASGEGSSGSGGSSAGATGASQSSSTGPNLLLLTGTNADIAKAQQILAEVDVQPAQIDFETKVTEIDVNKIHGLGLNWDFNGATTRIGEETDNIANPPATLGDNNQTNLLSFGAIGRTAVSDLATITLDAMINDNDAKLLADPNISAIDGQPAQVFIGNTVNYVESITQTTTGQNITTASVQVGVILRVTGKVGADGYITLNIHPEVSEITSYLTVPGGGSLPEVASRYADTTIRVKNGETIAIGGLIQENDTTTVNKVPGLGDLPFFGKLFQDDQTNRQRTEVVFLLTTRIAS